MRPANDSDDRCSSAGVGLPRTSKLAIGLAGHSSLAGCSVHGATNAREQLANAFDIAARGFFVGHVREPVVGVFAILLQPREQACIRGREPSGAGEMDVEQVLDAGMGA